MGDFIDFDKPLPAPANPKKDESASPEPSKLQQLGETVVNVVKGMMQGQPTFVSDEVKNARLAICSTCEFFNKEDVKCAKCGCFMALKTKVERAACPLKKW